MRTQECRFCKQPLEHVLLDLLNSPPSNSFLTEQQLGEPEVYFPLKVFVCSSCFLVQIVEYKSSGDIFNSDYVYFSSFSTTWLKHAEKYSEMMIERFGFNSSSQVIEIASNDGYLLQYFKHKNIPVLGIEPTSNTADVARKKGIETITEFFGVSLAGQLTSEGRKADLLLGNNVLAHVPDILDFVGGMKIILSPNGVITMEFPHLLQMIGQNQFDTIYHEHFSYLSLYSVKQIFGSQGLRVFDVEEIPTHGGSLRIYACHEDDTRPSENRVTDLLDKEINAGVNNLDYYRGFQQRTEKIKLDMLHFLVDQKKAGKKVAAYGAAAKGNTLLNYCGIKNDLVAYVVDANPNKQDKYLPASHIPVVNEQHLRNDKPDYVWIFPWNIKDEITEQLKYIKEWNGRFVTAIPEVRIL